MFCRYCGAPNPDGASFCSNCGKPIPVKKKSAPQPLPFNPAPAKAKLNRESMGSALTNLGYDMTLLGYIALLVSMVIPFITFHDGTSISVLIYPGDDLAIFGILGFFFGFIGLLTVLRRRKVAPSVFAVLSILFCALNLFTLTGMIDRVSSLYQGGGIYTTARCLYIASCGVTFIGSILYRGIYNHRQKRREMKASEKVA